MKFMALMLILITFVALLPANAHISFASTTAGNSNTTATNTTDTSKTTSSSNTSSVNILNYYIGLPEPVIGLCYPWLILTHEIISLPTGVVYPGIGGDTAIASYCGDNYFVVQGEYGVYVFNKTNGLIMQSYYTNNNTRFVGVASNSIAFYNAKSNSLLVRIINGNGFVSISYNVKPVFQSYSVIDGLPIVLYSSVNGTYYLANPSGYTELNVAGDGALLLVSSTAYVETNSGLAIIQITNPSLLSYTVQYVIPLPFTITDMLEVTGNYLLADTYGNLISIGINPNSAEFTQWNYIGSAVPTQVGYYVPSTGTSYVFFDNFIYPINGYAVARLGNAIFVDEVEQSGSSIIPVSGYIEATKFSELVLKENISGVMYVNNYAIAVNLPPGVWLLPYGAVILYGPYSIVLNQPQIIFPSQTQTTVTQVPNIEYTVSEFPTNYFPIAEFSNVKGVYTGAGGALFIQPNEAILYFDFGVGAIIKGTWQFGGVGDGAVVLYDGATFRIFDWAGNPITSLQYYVASPPLYTTVVMENGIYHVILYYSNKIIDISKNGVNVNTTNFGIIADPTGLEELLTSPPVLEYNNFVMPLQMGAFANINHYYATWVINNSLYILSLPDSSVYVLTNIPANVSFYPLSSNYIIMEKGSNVYILPYKSWVVGNCYINVSTYKFATVYFNGQKVSNGSLRVYSACGETVNLTATAPYYTPVTKFITVSGPTTLNLYPIQENASVTLYVSEPNYVNLSSLTLNLNGKTIQWPVGATEVLPAGPYDISLVSEEPVSVCAPVNFTQTFTQGANQLNIECSLNAGVIALYSTVSVNAKVVSSTGVYSIISVPANQYVDIAVPYTQFPAKYNITVLSTSEYTGKSYNVTVSVSRVYFLNITPSFTGELEVSSNLTTASIEVENLATGQMVETGTGSLEAELQQGNYMVIASAPGYNTYTNVINITPGQIKTVYAEMVPITVVKPHVPFYMNRFFQILVVVIIVASAIAVIFLRRKLFKKKITQQFSQNTAEVT